MKSQGSKLRAFTSPLSLLGTRSAWALADQVLISFTNFATMILVARGLHDAAAFGTFTLVYSALLFANVIQSALVAQPHNVLGVTRHDDDYRRFTTSSAMMQLALLVLLLLLSSGVAVGAVIAKASFAPLLVALVPSIVAWQAQEFSRRVLYTEGRMSAAFANDLLSYGGQTLLIAILQVTHHLTGTAALYSLAITSAIASLLGAWQIRGSLARHMNRQSLKEIWHFGKWLAGSEILSWCWSLQLYLYLSAIILGTAASGTLRAAQILLGPTRVFAFFLNNILPIRFSRTLNRDGIGAMNSQMKRVAILAICVLGPYCLVLAIWPRLILTVAFGADYASEPHVLGLMGIATVLTALTMVLGGGLSARRMTRDIFLGNVWGGVAAVGLSWFFIRSMGIAGAVFCMITSSLVVLCYYIYRHRRRPAPPVQAAQMPILQEQPCAS